MAAPQAILNTIFATSVGLLVYLLLNPDGDVLIGLLASLIGSLSVTVVALILQSTLKRK
jgi:isocitrate dehydrogenase